MMRHFKCNVRRFGSFFILLSVATAHRDVLDAEVPSQGWQDGTEIDRPRWGYAPAQESVYSSNPFHHRSISQLFKRSCEVIEGSGNTITCTDVCCPGDGRGGWCCGAGLQCVLHVEDGPCVFALEWVTITETSTASTTVYSTSIESVADTTEWSTYTSFAYETTVRSDIKTETKIETVFTTAAAKKRDIYPIAPRMTPSPAHFIPHIDPVIEADSKEDLAQLPIAPQVTTAPFWQKAPGRLRPRQSLYTETRTTTTNTVVTITSTISTTSTYYFTASSTTDVEITSTYTSVIDAENTVTSTTTSTITPGASPPPSTTEAGAQETPPPSDTSPPKSSGLSKGAQAGIGAGTAGGSLIICILLAFFLRRRRKQRKAEVAEMISAAVAAANESKSPPPPPPFSPTADKQVVVGGGYYNPSSPPPPPNSASPVSQQQQQPRYSNLPIAADQQYGGGTPAPQYTYPPPGQGYEMSGTPAVVATAQTAQVHYPRPVSPNGVPRGRAEMYTMPSEAPGGGAWPTEMGTGRTPVWRG